MDHVPNRQQDRSEVMSQDVTPKSETPANPSQVTNSEPTAPSENAVRNTRRDISFASSTKDFEGTTPKIGGVLGLRSEIVTRKITYDAFLEKLGIYIMTELKGGENIVEITKEPSSDIIGDFTAMYKPVELTNEEKESSIKVEIKKEEIKDYVRDLKTIKSNLKKVYTLVFGNCTDGVKTMLKADKEYSVKSKAFDHAWIIDKVKTMYPTMLFPIMGHTVPSTLTHAHP